MRTVLDSGKIAQTMHAVFDGSNQLTRWRTCKVSTVAAFKRSSHRTSKGDPLNRGVMSPGKLNRRGAGLTIRTKVFVTPAREKGGDK